MQIKIKSKIYPLGISFIIILILIGSCRNAGRWLVKDDRPVQADAMVILMGSISDRVLQAADLYRQKVSGKVIIVEASMGAYRDLEARGVHIISNTSQVRDALVTLGIPYDSISILPGDATSTQMEAMIVREYLVNLSCIDTLLLVSSSPHMRRASIIFKAAFKNAEKPVTILCSPSTYTNFDAGNWWKSKDGIEIVLLTYLKLVNFFVFERSKL